MKRFALVVAVLLAACGTEKAPQSAAGDGAGDGGGSMPVTSLLGITDTVKVVLKTTTVVFSPLSEYDGGTDTNVSIPCTVDATCTAIVAGAVCRSSICGVDAQRNVNFYVRDYPKAAAAFPVPCDGNLYTAEVIGGRAVTGGGIEITERHVAAPFTMPASCPTPASLPTLSWTSNLSSPGLATPTVYAGMGGTFNVSVTGLSYPWSRASWGVGYTGQAPTVVTNVAPFPVPATTEPLSFTGVFYLDASLRTDAVTAWWYSPPAHIVTPIGMGGFPFPGP